MNRIKRLMALLLASIMALSLGACGKKEEELPVTGGYEQKNTEPTDEDKEVFAKAVEGTEYADYTLTKLLATQVVAGINYRFQCKTPDGALKVMVVYRDLEQNCSVTSVEDFYN